MQRVPSPVGRSGVRPFGRTVDTRHCLVDEAAARESAYVAMSRGRDANTAYLVAQRDPNEHQAEKLDTTAAGRLAGVLGNVEAESVALVEQRLGAREGASLTWVGGMWDEVSKESARARYTETLAGLLPMEALANLTAEAGWPRLVRAVREAELAGHNSETVLTAAAAGRSLDDAVQVTDVLRWRVRTLSGDRRPEQDVALGDWTALAPPMDGAVGQFVHELAVLAGDRQHALGQAALVDPPAWAIAQLGPVPDGEDVEQEQERAGWAQRVGAVAAWRELSGLAAEDGVIDETGCREPDPQPPTADPTSLTGRAHGLLRGLLGRLLAHPPVEPGGRRRLHLGLPDPPRREGLRGST